MRDGKVAFIGAKFGVVSCLVPLRMGGEIIGEAHVDREGRVTATVSDPLALKSIMEVAPAFSVEVVPQGPPKSVSVVVEGGARATAIDKLLGAAERAALISGREHDDCPDHQLISKVADQIPGLLERVGLGAKTLQEIDEIAGNLNIACSTAHTIAAVRRLRDRAERAERALGARSEASKTDEVYEAHGEKFILPANVVEELKGAVPLLLERGDAETVVALRAAAGASARVRELEAGIRRALDHLGSAREEDSLDRRDQYRAEAERELERVL